MQTPLDPLSQNKLPLINPAQNKRQFPSPSFPPAPPDDIQPLKKSTVKSYTIDASKLKPIINLLFQDHKSLNYTKNEDGTLTVSNVIKSFNLKLTPEQWVILEGDPSTLLADDYLNAMILPVHVIGKNQERFHLSLLNIFYEKSPYADKLAELAKKHIKNSKVPFVVEAAIHIYHPYKSSSRAFVNLLYLSYTSNFLNYLVSINNNNPTLPVGNFILKKTEVKIGTITVFFEPSAETILYWTKTIPFILKEAMIAERGLIETANRISTPHIQCIHYLQQKCELKVTDQIATLKARGFEITLKGFQLLLDSFIIQKLVINLKKSNQLNIIENENDFLKELVGQADLRPFLAGITVLRDNPFIFKHGNIEYSISKLSATPQGLSDVPSTPLFLSCFEQNVSILFPMLKKPVVKQIANGYMLSDGEFRIIVNKTQYDILSRLTTLPNDSNLLTAALISPLYIYQGHLNEVYAQTSLLALFFLDNPATQSLIAHIVKFEPLIFNDGVVAAAVNYALFPYTSHRLYLNADYVSQIEIFYKNLQKLTRGKLQFPNDRSTPLKTGQTTWHFTTSGLPAKVLSIPNFFIQEASTCLALSKNINAPVESDFINQWKKFLSRIHVLNANNHVFMFEYKGSVHELTTPVSETQIYKQIISDEIASEITPQAPVAAVRPEIEFNTDKIIGFIPSLIRPINITSFSISIEHPNKQFIIKIKSENTHYEISLDEDQFRFLADRDSNNPASLYNPYTVRQINGESRVVCGYGSLFQLFFDKSPEVSELIEKLKGKCSSRFFANAAWFATLPFKVYSLFLNPEYLSLIKIFHENLKEINNGNDVFTGYNDEKRIVTADVVWKFDGQIQVNPIGNNLFFKESEEIHTHAFAKSGKQPNFPLTDHFKKWRTFLNKTKYQVLDPKTNTLSFNYNGKILRLFAPSAAANKLFIEVLEGEVSSYEESLPSLPPPPALIPSSQPNNQSLIPIPQIEYARISNVIETFWLQNPVNYSRWIKLLRDSKAVFSFASLPNELMEPLKGFKKEHVEKILKCFGVGSLFQGDLPDDLIEKSVPTLLRVKAAEFKLYKKDTFQFREERQVLLKPCYLVKLKEGSRFIHIIKVAARFDSLGFISGFVLNGEKAIEKNISLDEFKKIEDEAKNKRAIVLQRETIKLVEAAHQEISPSRQKREREDLLERKVDGERESKEAKSDPILPPVPQAKIQKRPLEADGTVHPKAPKESKHTDKGDITTDRPRAIGNLASGGIVPPPEMIEKPAAPSMQDALTLDELFCALSLNASAQVNHVIKNGINLYKAIFAEEPLAYEGLEHIRKLNDTPLPLIPCLVPKAKKYQWELVQEVERREIAGLGTILAPYMGLGKTWIYVSKIVLSLYKGSKGHHFIITPKPLRETIRKDAEIILNNARLNAFIQLKSIKRGEWCIKRIIQESNLDEKKFLLSLLGLFTEEEFNSIMVGRGPILNELCATFVENRYYQYPSKLKRLYEYCKNISPKELPEKGRFDEKGLEQILQFSSSRIRKCEEGKELLIHAQDQEAQIIIASYQQAEHLANNPKCSPGCANVIFDEAQYVHNADTIVSKTAEKLLKELKPRGKVAVTGTPIENGVEDLFQLVKLMAPELSCPAILNTLSNLSINASRYVKAKDRDLALSHMLKLHGHLQAYLTRISQNLVLLLQKDDPRVKEAWGEGATVEYTYENITLTSLAKQKYQEAHELFKTRKVDPNTGKKLDTNMAYYARVASILLDPELKVESLTKKDPSVQRLLKWIKAESDMSKINALIERSAILSAILNSSKTRFVLNEKKVGLIFVANIAVGKVIRKILKKKFEDVESYLMYGDQNDVKEIKGDKKEIKKDIIIDKLKETGKTKFGILSIESGSAGFSIPEAAVTIMSDLSYNVATEMQAIARMVRATSVGLKQVEYLRFGIFSEAHIPVVQEIKKLTFNSFFTPAQTQFERLKDSAKLIRNNIYQSFLNEKRDVTLASDAMIEIDELINSLIESVDEEELNAFVERLIPALPNPLPQPARVAAVAKNTIAPPLRIAGNKLFKVPLPNSLSNEDKVRLAYFIQANRQALEAPIKEIYAQLKNPELRNFVRTGAEMPNPLAAKACRTLLNLIKDAQTNILSIDDIGIDLFKIVGKEYVQEEKTKEECSKRVKLVKGANDVLEILI